MATMRFTETARTALRMVWDHKVLWFFGFFVAGSGGAGVQTDGGAGAAGGGAALAAWVVPLVLGALVLGLGFLVMHVLAEAALIEGVRRERRGEALAVRPGLREGRRHFWTLLGLKAGFLLAGVGAAAVLATPAVLAATGVIGVGMAVVLGLPLVVVAVPALLTLYFLYEWAMRFIVLEDRTAGEALAAARRFLPERLSDSLQLTVMAFLGQVGGGLAAVVGLLPAAAVGGLLYLAAGTVPAIVGAALLAVPVAAVAAGATGAFRSSVWTLRFLELRSA